MAPVNLAVFGAPIEHSRSPELHRAAYARLGLDDWAYGRREVHEAELAEIVHARDESWRGLSLTMPLKGEAFRLAGVRDDESILTGAVNTLLFLPGEDPRGYNTDIAGIAHAVRGVVGESVLPQGGVDILGAGATAASALVASARLGATHVRVFARTPEKAAHLEPIATHLGIDLTVAGFDAFAASARTNLVISTLPGGAESGIMFPAELRARTVLFDVAYSPWPSALASEWVAEGGIVVSGLEMLVRQALVQVRIFVGHDPALPLPDEPAVLAEMYAAVGLRIPVAPTP
ncbi:shikimate dehydrogenase [Mycetocola tolaasinivorans]|uniref:Shikimate dehydrogenase n=1 Tax=Mycetocola tolaasinivorans TaxID=76635 RepID=A0A3L7AB68_9MICO|nr:shikimate dehydrogenase [Mycetocola tolaasinivorans]RLP77060.1 shikimate dehydrogenase [Mycetocola tolaasinivorans]